MKKQNPAGLDTRTQWSGDNAQAGGFPCPQCGSNIRPSLERILARQPVFCSGCGLRLMLDSNASEPALELLQNMQQQIRDARKG